VIFSRQDERKGFGEDAKIMSRPHSEPAPAVNNRLGSVRLRQMSIIAVALILGSWGCQSVSTGLHDQLVRGSAVSPEEEREHSVAGSRWWTNWFAWLKKSEAGTATPVASPPPVQPDQVTPATAWHVLQQLRAEVERDRQNPGD
jgi:hypothetical protein